MTVDKKLYDHFVEQLMPEIWDIAKYVHANPETAYQEKKACGIQCEYLRKQGFRVQEGVEELDTAYIAVHGEGKPAIAVLSEYDALPMLGHGCGHNLICTSALITVTAMKRCMEDHDLKGTLYVIGTPAEESGGGKIQLLNKGIFKDIDAVIMMHPTSDKSRLAGACMSSKRIHIRFTGQSAHAGSHPEDGINALSAANLYFVATGLLRQHFKGDMRLSGIITKGGKQTGLIPDEVEVEGSISSFSLAQLEKNAQRVKDCALGSAMCMGCSAEVEIQDGYQGRIPNQILSDVCRKELENIDEPLLEGMPFDYGGEDLGNISRVIPICNPYITIFPDYKISNHTEQFRELANSDAGYHCIEVSGKAMTRTLIDLFLEPDIIDQAKKELQERLEHE